MPDKKYISLNRLSDFFDNLKEKFAEKSYVESLIPTTLPASGGNSDTVNGFAIQRKSQEEYDALAVKDPNTLYIIV